MSASWMPYHFQKLQEACLKNGAGPNVTPMDIGFSIHTNPAPYVRLLSSSASKFRLAKYCKGLKGPEEEVRTEHRIGQDYFKKYSAQLIVTLSFVALETYLRMLQKEWASYQIQQNGKNLMNLTSKLRDEFSDEDFGKLITAMEHQKLKKRLREFWEGDDQQFLATISAIRNSFSHGKMGINRSVSYDCAEMIKDHLLDSIVLDTDLIIQALETQDPSVLRQGSRKKGG